MTLDEATSLCLAHGFQLDEQVGTPDEIIPYVRFLHRGFHYLSLIAYDPVFMANRLPRTYAEMKADAPFRMIDPSVRCNGTFVEGCFEVYLAPKNTRRPKTKDFTKESEQYSEHQKKGFIPIRA